MGSRVTSKNLKFENIGLNKQAHNLIFIDLNLLIMPMLMLQNIKQGCVIELLPKDLKFGNIGLNEQEHNLIFIDLNVFIMPILTLYKNQQNI